MSGLPKGWAWAKMLDVLNYEGGTQPPKSDFIYEPRDGYVRLLQIRDFGDKPFPTYIPDSRKLKKASADDLLIARYGGSSANDSLGRICTGLSGAYNVALAKLVLPADLLDKGFVKFLFMGPWFRDVVGNNSRSCQTGFNREDVAEILFPIAPLNEQRRIVAKLDVVLDKVDACHQRLAKIPVILKRFRQTVLAAACSGRLTADWREEQGHGEGEELPERWTITPLSEVCTDFQYGTSSKSKSSGDVSVLRMGNLQSGKIDWADLVYTSDKHEIKKYRLEPGDVLFNRTNSPELVGKTSIYLGERPAVFAGYLIRIKNKPSLDSFYLNYCLNSNSAKEWCQQVKTDGVSQSNINAQKLAAFKIPFPPIEEQREIVHRVEALFTLADQLEARYLKAKGHIDRLTQSILAKAFRGELVPQDENDEPAAVLLERIRGQHSQAVQVGRRSAPQQATRRSLTSRTGKPATLSLVAETPASYVRNIPQTILAHMQPRVEYSRADIADALGLSTSDWNWAIRQLKEEGKVVQTGERRGARYRLS